jgi:hypothetical protein
VFTRIRQSALVTTTSFGTIFGLASSSLPNGWMRLELGEKPDSLAKLAVSAQQSIR